jgi:hypothetical protein
MAESQPLSVEDPRGTAGSSRCHVTSCLVICSHLDPAEAPVLCCFEDNNSTDAYLYADTQRRDRPI